MYIFPVPRFFFYFLFRIFEDLLKSLVHIATWEGRQSMLPVETFQHQLQLTIEKFYLSRSCESLN
jgi:hypothetical protein